MFKELEIMEKTLRYLLIAVTVLSVLSLSAQTHQYATTHSHEQAALTGAYVNPQMPAKRLWKVLPQRMMKRIAVLTKVICAAWGTMMASKMKMIQITQVNHSQSAMRGGRY